MGAKNERNSLNWFSRPFSRRELFTLCFYHCRNSDDGSCLFYNVSMLLMKTSFRSMGEGQTFQNNLELAQIISIAFDVNEAKPAFCFCSCVLLKKWASGRAILCWERTGFTERERERERADHMASDKVQMWWLLLASGSSLRIARFSSANCARANTISTWLETSISACCFVFVYFISMWFFLAIDSPHEIIKCERLEE